MQSFPFKIVRYGVRHFHQTCRVKLRKQSNSSPTNSTFSIEQLYGGSEDGAGQGAPACTDPELVRPTFRSKIVQRREEAKRSLLVQVKSAESAHDLLNHCTSSYGPVRTMNFHHNPHNPDFPNFFVVEFESEDSVMEALRHGGHSSRQGGHGQLAIPVTSPFMWFSGKDVSSPSKSTIHTNTSNDNVPIYVPTQKMMDKSDQGLEASLIEKNTMSQQMRALHDFYKLSNLDTRLRFLACRQLELALSGLFPQAEVVPFGSSVNTFGANTTDLDMIVNFASEGSTSIQESRLQFHTKVDVGSRSLSRTYCNEIASLVEHFLPGCQDIQRIPRARIPIFSYRQTFLGIDVDVTFEPSGTAMSELLYLFGELDQRVRPLVFNVRHWSTEQGLIGNTRPTQYFKNFQITLLVIFFLQNKYGMLPSFNDLKKKARPEDKFDAAGLNLTFVRDISGLQPILNREWTSQTSLSQMLIDFFEFYSTFEFEKYRLCLLTGDMISRGEGKRRLERERLYVVNPIQPDRNATDNVSNEVLEFFQKSCTVALRRLFALDSLSQDAKLKHSKLSYVFTSTNSADHEKIYGLQSLEAMPIRPKSKNMNNIMSHRDRRKQEEAKGKFMKLKKKTVLKDIL